jgi:hypothetical protein
MDSIVEQTSSNTSLKNYNVVSHPVPDRYMMYQSQAKGETLVRDYLNERQTIIKINKAILQGKGSYQSS